MAGSNAMDLNLALSKHFHFFEMQRVPNWDCHALQTFIYYYYFLH